MVKKIFKPLLAFLSQGIEPSKMALAVALGVSIAVFPVFGSTTLLCTVVALVLRLNMPLIQTVNYLAYPLQFIFFLPFIRMGEWLFSAPPMSFSISAIFKMFKEDLFHAISVLWLSTLHAMVAWVLTAPLVGLLLFFITRPVFRRMSEKLTGVRR